MSNSLDPTAVACKPNDPGAEASGSAHSPAQRSCKLAAKVWSGYHQLRSESEEEERKRLARLIFNDFLVKLLQGRPGLFDVF